MLPIDTCEHRSSPLDLDAVADALLPSVSKVLEQNFGSDFSGADLDEKLELVETIAYTLRLGGSFLENLILDLPDLSITPAPLQVNEALKLLSVLHAAIAEDYSVAKFRLDGNLNRPSEADSPCRACGLVHKPKQNSLCSK